MSFRHNPWDAEQTLEELMATFRRNHRQTHGYDVVYVPYPLTKEWVIDQLKAIDWYAAYEFSIKRDAAPEPKPKPKAKRKSKPICPF